MTHSIDFHFSISGEEPSYEVAVSCSLDKELLFTSKGHFPSLLESIDDARFHADALIGLLRATMLEKKQ